MSNLYFQQPNPINIGMGINIFKTTTSKGIYNIGIGGNIFVSNTSSINNTVGINNLGLGGNVFVKNTVGTNNIGIGGNVFGSNITGNYNIGVGNNSGNSILGSYNTMVGANTGQSGTDGNTYNNSTALGYGATVNASNQIVLGTTTESVVIPSITPANNSTSGALVVSGGVGIGGNVVVNGSINPSQIIESINVLTFGSSITANYNTGLVFSIPSATGTITNLTLTNLPTTSNKSYTFTFIMGTTNSSAYISAGTISVNGSSVNLQGAIISTVPSYYIVQQIILFNLGGTFNVALTTASFF
jgi:hypothetical protein